MSNRRNGTTPAIIAGQAVYTNPTLDLCDFVVLGVSNSLIRKCPSGCLLEHYNANVRDVHLDVGVGTGWFLDNCRFPHVRPRITLFDLNSMCLKRAATRIQRYDPKTVQANVLEPMALETRQFGSIGLNYLLHCLPRTLKEKAAVFDQVKSYLASGGIVFGSTLLAGGVKRSPIARALMRLDNSKGVFSDQGGSMRDLELGLAARFRHVRLEVIGCAALFTAQ